VLPEVADFSAPKTPVGAWLSLGGWHEMGQVSFDVSFDAGAGAGESAETQQLIANELVIGGTLERQKALKE